jgi:4-hydroxy-tetrahydrodipicolinate synthase
MYSMDRPFTGLIKEAIRLCGLDISTALAAPASPPDAALIKQVQTLLLRAGLLTS